MAEYYLLGVEIATALLGLILLVMGLLVPKTHNKGIANIAIIGFIAIFGVNFLYAGTNASFLNGMYLIDPFSLFFKGLLLIAVFFTCLISKDYILEQGYGQGEYYSLVTFATLGMMIMVSAGDLITFYLGLELNTIAFVILVAFRKNCAKSTEAGIKYVLLSAMSSAVLLYGLSLVYGATKSVLLTEIAKIINQQGIQPLLLIGMIFTLAGFGFKVSAVPFHMWSPDVYEGAPTPITGFMSVASKAAAFAIFVRFFMIALAPVQETWVIVITALTVLTLVLGNLVAIPQTNIKRMLAYSSVGQAGFILLGMVAFSKLGVAAIMFHSLLYVFANMGAFGVATVVGKSIGSDQIKDYQGLWKRSPLMAAVMLICLLSLAGIPPLAGFVSKFYLFTAVIEQGHIWLAFIAIGMSMVSVYYYLIVAKAMYLGQPEEGAEPIKVPGSVQLALALCLIVLVFFGVYPTPFTNLVLDVATAFFPF
ncbi:MAG: NADH-quinone oxidoreductase subunit [Clostridia bacterium]|jgi:NADH-quinone oxidoreductase subunit N|nr:proton-translocating NADH-quinone oxidoreductase, chain [Clostridiales bacterium]MDK2984715.1 NADH-quinone oxidoreductase subunit [Clostridia bacterium]